MAYVVVGALLGGVEGDRQQRLGAVQRLDLGLLVQAQHHGSAGQVEVQPDDVGHLLRELRIPADLERAQAVRFEPVLAPQLRHPVMRHQDPLGTGDVAGHLPARPVRQTGAGRWHHPRQRQHSRPEPCRYLFPRPAWLPSQQPSGALGGVPRQPQIHRRT